MSQTTPPTQPQGGATGRTQPTTQPGSQPAASTKTKPAPAPTKDPLRGSRASSFWVSVAALGILLVLLVVFIAQNTGSVEVSYFGWSGSWPLSVVVLIAFAAGLLITVLAGSLRILQLRRRVKRAKS